MFNKKGDGEVIMVTVSVIFLALLVAIMFFYFTINDATSEKREETLNQVDILSDRLTLLNYLRTPVEGMFIADLIVKSELEDSYSEFDEATLGLLGSHFSRTGECCWILTLEREKKFLHEVSSGCGIGELNPVVSEIKIPSLTDDIIVKLTLFQERLSLGGTTPLCEI